MRFRRCRMALLFLLLAGTASGFAQAPDLSAVELARKLIDARGGAARLKSVRSQRVTGTLSFGAGIEGPLVVELKRPGKLHMEMQIQGQTVIRVYDGKGAGWMVNPFAPEKGAVALSGNDLRNAADESDFDGPLVDYQAKGTQLEYLGKDQVAGKPAYKLKLVTKSGDARTYFIDAATFLLLKWEGVRRAGDEEIPVQSFFRDYREVDGIKFAFQVDTEVSGGAESQKLTIEKIELNVDLDDSLFAKPSGSAN